MSEINVEPHLVPEYTDRGFKHMPPIGGARLISGTPSASCARVYESSAASEPRLWLQVQEDGGRSNVQLTLENALRLADQIQFLAANHYQILAEFRDEPASRSPAAEGEGKKLMITDAVLADWTPRPAPDTSWVTTEPVYEGPSWLAWTKLIVTILAMVLITASVAIWLVKP